MADLAAFAEKNFDAKRWINDACDARPPEEAIER
jgi:hypothetical protein